MTVKIPALTPISALADADVLEIVDVSVTTDDPTGSSRKVTIAQMSAQFTVVPSVFGRTGAIVAKLGDYKADQVTYDNASSGLGATQVQQAIDEVNNRIPTVAVSSVFGRTGAVVAAANDYNGDQVKYDPNKIANNVLTATTMQDALDELVNLLFTP